MKKLLSILAISGSITIASSNTISCFGRKNNNKNSFPRYFKFSELQQKLVPTADKLYDSVRSQIADQVKDKNGKAVYANGSAVKNDANFEISIFQDKTLIKDESKVDIEGGNYLVTLSANKDDQYFKRFTKRNIPLTVKKTITIDFKRILLHWPKISYPDHFSVAGDSKAGIIYDKFYEKMNKNETIKKIYPDGVNKDTQGITLQLTSDGKVYDYETPLQLGNYYNMNITVKDNKYFVDYEENVKHFKIY